ncbi:hypothetical protein [Paenibacillus sp. ACRRY]|uniref:hypothetical protein n=1 Tax=Paenibacillus sp. ACRRY TaxID=2918208 RepID=UPI001EF65AE3|nr:hypothetical protein [Paenibacillus sp. ACRRY]
MNKQQLNTMAIAARNGDDAALWEVKAHFQKMIHSLSEANRNRVKQEHFEEQCFDLIDETIMDFDGTLGDFSQLVVHNIKRRLGRTKKRHSVKCKGIETVSLPCRESEDGFVEMEFVDDLAIVDDNFLTKEKITSLAAGDQRKMRVLTFMIDPGYSESSTARLLAQQDGKNVDTHRKFIQRLRKDCQKVLAHAI